MNERKSFQTLKQKKRNNTNSASNINNSNANISGGKFKCSNSETME